MLRGVKFSIGGLTVAAVLAFLAALMAPACMAAVSGPESAAAAPAPADAAARGEALYREGRLASGAPVQAQRLGGPVEGAAAACVNCHRRSGLGSYEGSILVPPIIGPYLFRERAANTQDLNLPHIRGFTPNAYAYTDLTLAAAIRTGVTADGRVMNALMPRYSIDDASLAALLEYLKTLSAGPFPGVGDQVLELATIVTPDADPDERAAMLKVIEEYFRVRNTAVAARIQGAVPAVGGGAEYHAVRHWHLQVWELAGPADTWEEQLQKRQSADPVFAVISGLGRATWTPVQSFCERHQVPCVFPNIDVPSLSGTDDYSIYFSRGVVLEADLIFKELSAKAATGRIVQVYRSGDIGAAAAGALTRSTLGSRVVVTNRVLPTVPTAPSAGAAADETAVRRDLKEALTGLRPLDTLVLWLRPRDIAALGAASPPSNQIYLSGSMANGEDAPLPAAWRESVHMAYPFDPPDRRRMRENFPHAWFHQHGIPLTADRVQSNTYLACSMMADVFDAMLDSYVPDFFIERLEMMAGNQLSTGFFPRLSLGSGQRYASKGGYIVKFAPPDHVHLVVEGDWVTP
jgi:cytochrome c553